MQSGDAERERASKLHLKECFAESQASPRIMYFFIGQRFTVSQTVREGVPHSLGGPFQRAKKADQGEGVN